MLLDRLAAVDRLQVVAWDTEPLLAPMQDMLREDILVGVFEQSFQLAIVITNRFGQGKREFDEAPVEQRYA